MDLALAETMSRYEVEWYVCAFFLLLVLLNLLCEGACACCGRSARKRCHVFASRVHGTRFGQLVGAANEFLGSLFRVYLSGCVGNSNAFHNI